MNRIRLIAAAVLYIQATAFAQVNQSFVFDGLVRTYVVYLPQSYQAGDHLPLMIALHGLTQSGNSMMGFSNFNAVADTGNFIVVYPDGVGNAWNVGFSGGSTADDVGFISALIDTLAAHYQINTERVYACGFSNGGFLSYRLACELTHRIAAIGPVAGTMTDGSAAGCQPEFPIPVLHIHGTADIVVSYNGGFGNQSVNQVLDLWNGFDGCPADPVIVNLPDIVAEGSTVQRLTWSPCLQGVQIQHLKVINGGHTWPGSVGTTGFGNTNRDINASSEIWNFVKQYSLPHVSGFANADKPVCAVFPNPAGYYATLKVSKVVSQSKISVYTIQGMHVKTIVLPAFTDEFALNVSDLPQGIYILSLSSFQGIANVRMQIIR